MLILEENIKRHLEAFASELFNYKFIFKGEITIINHLQNDSTSCKSLC